MTGAGAGRWENCVTIPSLYRDKRAAWSWACHDTIDCIVIGEKKVRPLAVSRYSTARVAIRRRGTRVHVAILLPRPTTRPVLGHDTAPLRATIRRGACGLGAPCAQPGPLGVHLCTQPGFGLSALF